MIKYKTKLLTSKTIGKPLEYWSYGFYLCWIWIELNWAHNVYYLETKYSNKLVK